MRSLPLFVLLAGLLLMTTGCDSTTGEDFAPAASILVENLAADPAIRDPQTGRPTATGRFTLYSLRENRVVPNADSATAQWDIGLRQTRIIFNSGASGPGQGGARLVNQIFEEVREIPANIQFATDTTATRLALTPQGNNPNGWYTYTTGVNPAQPQAGVITPTPGRTILVRTADGRFAKVRVLHYYRNRPANIDPLAAEAGYYTFEFAFQADGSRRFE